MKPTQQPTLEQKPVTEQEAALSAEQLKHILAERAKALAQEPQVDELEKESLQVLTFSLSGESYGIQIDFVEEVQPIKKLTPIPCTPVFVLGAVNLRGNILSVLDIRKFFNLPTPKISTDTKIIVVEASGLRVGILADMVHHIKRIPLEQIEPPIATLKGIEQEYIQGVTQDMLIVLDVAALMGDKRIIVHEEVA